MQTENNDYPTADEILIGWRRGRGVSSANIPEIEKAPVPAIAPTTLTKAARGVDWVLVAYVLLLAGAVGLAVAVRVGWV